MAILEVKADLKALTAAVTRVAVALEEVVLRAYGVTLRPTPAPAKDESDVAYASDHGSWVRELQDLDKHRNPERVISNDDEDEG